MISKKALFSAIAIAAVCCSFVSAATLVDFKPVPVTPGLPEFVFNGGPAPSFKEGPASHGNGDGALPVGVQTPGGLDAETPFTLPPIPGSLLTGTGSTLFHDATLILNGLVANGAASAPFGPGGPLIQPLGIGSFQLLSTGPPSAGAPTLLLSGNIGAATFIVGNADAGATFNGSFVDYTGGVIYGALIAAGGNPLHNSMSFSMTDVNPNFSINGISGYLSDFDANGTGLFSFNPVPEPSTLCLLMLGSIAFIGRRR
jgi:PEP-CTERM motif